MKLPQEIVAMLEEHCEKLEYVEQVAFDNVTKTGAREDLEVWLTAQNQLRLTAIELEKRPVRSEKPARRMLAESKEI